MIRELPGADFDRKPLSAGLPNRLHGLRNLPSRKNPPVFTGWLNGPPELTRMAYPIFMVFDKKPKALRLFFVG